MGTTNVIYQKLEGFIRKYYTNELLRGVIFFIGIGLLYFFLTLSIEYFLWLKPLYRTLLFWAFVGVEVFLLTRFVLFPVFRLFKLRKGIGYREASVIIGNHFGEVSDKLTNFLQLSSEGQKSELLLASIEQKAAGLRVVPFSNAVSFKSNRKYLPLAVLPVLFLLFFWLSGNDEFLNQSFNRVVHYQSQFAPPAPFEIRVINQSLQVEQNQDFVLRVKTEGKVVPDQAMIYFGEESYYMESIKPGEFQYVFSGPKANTEFYIRANQVQSVDYELAVITVPSVENFEMRLQFPAYLNKKAETIQGGGNAIVPEGTKITWNIHTVATDKVDFSADGKTGSFAKEGQRFSYSRSVSRNTEYQIRTSNKSVKDYEKLNYRLSVIKDQFPTISASVAPDSLGVDKKYVLGQLADDYGLSRLQIVYYPVDKPAEISKAQLSVRKDVFDQFVFSFPSTLPVKEGVSYDYYFEVFDNDVLNGFKSSKSGVFSSRIQTDQEKQDEVLQQQNSNLNSLSKSLENQEKQLSDLDKLQQAGKEKESLEFKDQQKMNDFIKRQQQQDKMMKDFAKKLNENLEKFDPGKKDEFKEELQRRLEKTDEELEKNQKLLDQLKELNDKISKEELFEKMEEFKQKAKNQTKTLEQLVELTKRYYVEKKAEQIADKLDKLGQKQEALSEKDKEITEKAQDEINKEFEEIRKEKDELEKENQELKSPMEIPGTESEEKSIQDDLNKAKEQLQKQDSGKAKPKQKSAAKKMKEMGGNMMQMMGGGQMEQMEEDVKMLRQILDNLLAFSFSEEDLMNDFKSLRRNAPSFNKNLKLQQDLKLQFRHVDDSLFAMSLRNPKITENVTTEIGNVHYNVDKSLEAFADAQVSKGTSHQQYAIAAANKLADFLSQIMNSMQMQMQMSGSGNSGTPKPGQGAGEGMQLPDIIQKQQGLGQKMKDGMQSGSKPGEKPGSAPGDKPGQGKKPGQQGQSGGEGGKGQQGKGGSSGQGSNGSSGGGNGQGQGNRDGDARDGESDAQAIMEIYKEQRQLREALERELRKQGMSGNGQAAINQMKDIEKQLLNKGFNNEVLQKALNLKYELLKLEKAVQQQGEEKKRQSESNRKEFTNPSNALPAALKDYLNSVEILNRQRLPLRTNYNQKVQEYFKAHDQL